MHGLEKIRELNELAAHNAPGAAEKILAEAEKAREGKVNPFDKNYQAAVNRAYAEREDRIKALETRDLEELLVLLEGVQFPTVLESALARKLRGIFNKNETNYEGEGHA